MRVTSPTLLNSAMKVAEEMLKRGESIREVPFGATRECLFVSSDKQILNWTDRLSVKGVYVYLGTKKETAAHT